MSMGYYRFIKGRLIVRQNQSPDGDSMRFIADDMTLFTGLPNYAPAGGSQSGASYQLRFQAIDTPELHYGSAKQPQGMESRDALLRWLGVDPSAWDWEKAPVGFSWDHPAAILCDGFEGHGRPIAFVLKGLDAQDGSDLRLSPDLLEQTYNYHAVRTGNAYLGLYAGGLPPDLRDALITAYKAAKAEQAGLWPLDQTSCFTVNRLADICTPDGSLIYPKIFRRCVDALRWAGGLFRHGRDIDDFFAANPRENDTIIVHTADGGTLKCRLSDVIEQLNNQICISVDLNTVEFISK